jgi:hypothetical protein
MTVRPARVIVACGCLIFVTHLAAMLLFAKPNGRVVFGDATHHFVQLRSIVYDHDLHFTNDYSRIYEVEGELPGLEWIFTELTPTGHVRNYMPVGPAILWAPLYLLLSAALGLGSRLGLTAAPDGFDWVLQLVPGVTGVITSTTAAWLAWRMARRVVDETSALVGVVGVWLGSHALYYALVSPSYSHAPSMLTGAVFFSVWSATRGHLTVRVIASYGALAGLCALMRWQDAIFMLVPLVEIVRWQAPLRKCVVAALAAGTSFLVVFSPQMIVWSVLYGQPFAIPQGPSFMQWTSPHPIAVLFSDNHGLFSWAPILVPAVAGLFAAVAAPAAWRLPLAVVLVVSWYVNAAVADWWAGEAFGARRFLSLFVLFCVGLALWVGRAPVASRAWFTRVAGVGVLLVLNGLLLLQYQVFMKGLTDIAPYPAGAGLWFDRFIVPVRLVGWWWNQ